MSQTKAQLIDGKSAEIEFTGGSASGPAISFTGDSNTGIYSPGADQVAVATNGVGRLFVDASGNVGVGNSSIYGPLDVKTSTGKRIIYTALSEYASNGIIGVTDAGAETDLGLGGNNLLFFTNATERLRITSAGLVGIGTSSVGALLHASTAGTVSALNEISRIESTAANSGPSFTFYGKQGSDASTKLSGLIGFTQTQNSNSDGRPAFVVHTGNNGSVTEKLRVTHDGLVGIGTTSVNAPLHVSNGGAAGLEFYPATYEIQAYNRSTSAYGLARYNAAGHQFAVSASEAARIDSSGRLGIGTSSPGALTHLSNTSSSTGYNFFQITAGSESQVHTIKSTISTGRDLEVNSARTLKFTTGSNTGTFASEGHFQFSHGTNGDLVRITADGKVGIGTSSPGSNLEIVGGTTTAGPGAELRLSSRDQTIAVADEIIGSVTFKNNDASGGMTGYMAKIDAASNRLFDGDPASGMNLRFFAGTAADGVNTPPERMRLTSAGRLGIGTASPSRLLHLSSASDVYIQVDRGSITSLFGTDNIGTYVGQQGAYDLRLVTNASERARIDSSGRLLVGTSTARAFNTHNGSLQIDGDNYSESTVAIIANSNDADGAYLTFAKQRSGSSGGNTVVQNNDIIGELRFNAGDGTDCDSLAGLITCRVDGTPGNNDMPGRLVFSTTADGASAPTERMRIEQSGNIRFMNTGLVFPLTDNAVSLGLNGYRWTEVWAANGTIQTSDQRAKTDITSATLGSDFVKSLRPVSYRWVEGGKVDSGNRDEDGNYIYESVPGTRTHWGFIAQEVKQAVDATGVDFGGWLLTDKDDPDSQQALRYDQFIAPLTKALQEAIAKIETLEGMVAVNNITIDEQQHQLSTLAARLTALESA
jgi:hypothetical protein